MKKFISIVGSLFLLTVLIAPVLVMAADTVQDPTNILPATSPDKLFIEGLLDSIINWVFAIMVVVGTIFIVLAAFQFVTGGGDPAKVAEARMKLIWAVLGFAVAILARGVQPLVKSLLGI